MPVTTSGFWNKWMSDSPVIIHHLPVIRWVNERFSPPPLHTCHFKINMTMYYSINIELRWNYFYLTTKSLRKRLKKEILTSLAILTLTDLFFWGYFVVSHNLKWWATFVAKTICLFLRHFFTTFFFFFVGWAKSLLCFHLGSIQSSATDTWLHVGARKLITLWLIQELHSPGTPLAPRKQRENSITQRRLGFTSAHISQHCGRTACFARQTQTLRRRVTPGTDSRLATFPVIWDEMKNEPTYFEVTTSEQMKSRRWKNNTTFVCYPLFVCLFSRVQDH